MKLTTRQKEVLLDIWRSNQRGTLLPKAYFDTFPHKRKIAKDLMWAGYVESAGNFGDYVKLTPAGVELLDKACSDFIIGRKAFAKIAEVEKPKKREKV